MKYLKLIILLCSGLAVAQIQTPQPSPSTTLEQVVGLTEVKIEYSRPAMRGRTIMGDLVPYGSLWRTGANKNTTLSFSDPVTVGGQALAAGTYALFTRPGKSLWEVFFYTETENLGLPQEWQSKSVAAVIEVPTQSLAEPEESFTISINELTNTGANIHLSWENTRVTLPLEVPTDEKTMASIKETMKGTPKAGDLYQAAVYYRESGRDLQTAKKWIGKAIEMNPGKYWMFRQQALILADLNEKEAAIKAAQSSLELAEKTGNQDYVRLNTKAIEEWSK
jgi:hypothetical protein